MDAEVKADQAKALLENPMFRKAFDEVKEALYQSWSEVPVRDVEGREWIFKLFIAQQRFESIFKGYIDTGKLESVTRPKFKMFN
jgi:hypothetical protein